MLRSLGAAVAVAVTASLALVGCEPPPTTYVALGDSYVAGPLIPGQDLSMPGCLKSDRNYPHLVLPGIRARHLVDRSCSGAEIDDLYQQQDVDPNPDNPPQITALNRNTAVVTVGLGGNDMGFTGIVETCASQNPLGPGCRAEYVRDGRDEISERIRTIAPELHAALVDVRRRAPRAQVFVVGYPTVLPETGDGCYPRVPILPGDVPYLRAKAKELNAMLRAQARRAGVHYVDTATPSIGHDVCALDRWVEGLVPLAPAAPVHPNAAGMRATAAVVTAAIDRVLG
jgi:lysophospholipase L1-like esterase